VVLELLRGGELFDKMSQGAFSEKVVAKIMFKLLTALEYLHSKVFFINIR
jgi:serine/threonine protein kinase